MGAVVWLSEDGEASEFPPAEQALTQPNGLLAAGGSLQPERLLAAYERGIFPWYSAGQPVLWWSPDPRAVLLPGEFHISRSLARRLRRGEFETRLDSDFPAVIRACAAPRSAEDGTWLTPEMIAAYTRLHELGYAHSIETWCGGALAGGLYGIRLGGVFFGESMFSLRPDASKIALARLVEETRARGMTLIDCQVTSAHLQSLGSRTMARTEFLALLAARCRPHAPGRWT